MSFGDAGGALEGGGGEGYLCHAVQLASIPARASLVVMGSGAGRVLNQGPTPNQQEGTSRMRRGTRTRARGGCGIPGGVLLGTGRRSRDEEEETREGGSEGVRGGGGPQTTESSVPVL